MTDNAAFPTVAELEWANYAATRPAADATPGLALVMRDDLILTCSEHLPMPDANHACLLRTPPDAIEALIGEVVDTFHSRGLAATLYVSPACSPPDLPDRLVARGFVAQPEEEAWMTLDLPTFVVPTPTPNIPVRAIERDEAETFARVFLTAFGMAPDFAPVLAQFLAPSIGLENARHYVAVHREKVVGTCSLLMHDRFGVVGSAGVIRSRASRGAATNMVVAAIRDALRHGCDTLMLQTTAGTMLERFLRIQGFRRAFTRTCYVLPCKDGGELWEEVAHETAQPAAVA